MPPTQPAVDTDLVAPLKSCAVMLSWLTQPLQWSSAWQRLHAIALTDSKDQPVRLRYTLPPKSGDGAAQPLSHGLKDEAHCGT